LEIKEIKGDLHVHSDFKTSSPLDYGHSSLGELLRIAEEQGYEYLGLSDHAPRVTSQSITKIKLELRRRKTFIETIFTHHLNSEY